MLEHGTKALGKLQEYSLEALVLQKLIDQRIYRTGKRGKWYDRLALIQATYLKDIPERQRKKMALQTCISGIQDPRVHQSKLTGARGANSLLITHFIAHLTTLQRRIHRLERDLCIPKREQHDFSYLSLKKPSEKTIHGK
jgi:Fanconi-associated nuclease 1